MALVPAATAEKPIRSFLPTGDPFVLEGSCAFDVRVETLTNKEFGTAFSDGRFLITGSFKVRLTNLDPGGGSIDVNISGPGNFTFAADGEPHGERPRELAVLVLPWQSRNDLGQAPPHIWSYDGGPRRSGDSRELYSGAERHRRLRIARVAPKGRSCTEGRRLPPLRPRGTYRARTTANPRVGAAGATGIEPATSGFGDQRSAS